MLATDCEAELSYAYLHAVAAKAGAACQVSCRLMDNEGIDASLHIVRDFGSDAVLTEMTLHVQLKATVKPLEAKDGRIPYFFKGVNQYDRLRKETAMPPKILVVLFLPKEDSRWLEHSEDELILRRCAYWVSLRGASDCQNDTGQTIHLPESQVFSAQGLIELFSRIARQEDLNYGA